MMEKVPVKAFIRIKAGCGVLSHDEKSVSIVKECGEMVRYEFDGVFGPRSTQAQVFDAVRSIVSRLANGHNQTLFCYGNTGAGKTYTMVGSKEEPGIMYNLVREILKLGEFVVSYMEIYNEKIHDLLEPKELVLREFNRAIVIPNVFTKKIKTMREFEEVFSLGTGNRTTAETKLNKNSSRSHAILRICVGECKLHLIDLAGSENNRKTGNEGIRLAESNNINRSLFVLGKVVNAVLKGDSRIPYRDSKLTRLLQDSLGGSSLCYIIANVIDDRDNLGDSINTLGFASKSRNIVSSGVKDHLKSAGSRGIGTRELHGYTKKCTDKDRKPLSLKTNIRFNLCRKKVGEREDGEGEKENSSRDESLVISRPVNKGRKWPDGNKRRKVREEKDFRCDDAFCTEEAMVIEDTPFRGTEGSRKIRSSSSSSILGSFLDKPDVILSPHTKEKSYKAFLKRAQEFESAQKYRLALEDYKTIQKFCDNDFVRQKIETISKLFKTSRRKPELSVGDVLNILNNGNFFDIKKLPNVGDKRAQAIVDFVADGNFFETLADLKLLFSEKIVKSILISVSGNSL